MTLGRELAGALENYFAGAPETFARIPLEAAGTEFQQRVWTGARGVTWGRTATYGELTAQLGLAPTSARAVGAALGANPIHLLIPCHRFLGANGSLTGFAGGLPWKQALLEREGSLLPTGE
jgi:methylated-DNA-[protein]-cysteine S-methyltransferase